MISILALYALLAAGFTVGKTTLMFLKPFFIVGTRMTVAGVVTLAYLWMRDKKSIRFDKQDWLLFGQVILFHVFSSYILEYWSLQYLSASVACLYFNLAPFFTALFAYFLLNERITRMQGLGLCIGFLGFIPILFFEEAAATFCVVSWPELGIILSVLTASYGWILVQNLVKQRNYSPLMVNGLSMFCGGLLALTLSLVKEGAPTVMIPNFSVLSGWDIKIIHSFGSEIGSVILGAFYLSLLIINTNLIFYNFYAYTLRFYSATLLALFGLTAPLFAALYDYILYRTALSWAFYATMIITSYGLYLFYRDELTQERT